MWGGNAELGLARVAANKERYGKNRAAYHKTFFGKNYTSKVELDLTSLIWSPKGGNRTLSITWCGEPFFDVFKTYHKTFFG